MNEWWRVLCKRPCPVHSGHRAISKAGERNTFLVVASLQHHQILSSKIKLRNYLCRWASGRAVWTFSLRLPCPRSFSHDSHVSWTFRAELKWYFSSLAACPEPNGADLICRCSSASLQEFQRGNYAGVYSLSQHQELASWLWESTSPKTQISSITWGYVKT